MQVATYNEILALAWHIAPSEFLRKSEQMMVVLCSMNSELLYTTLILLELNQRRTMK